MESGNTLSLRQLKADAHTALKHWSTIDDTAVPLLGYLLIVQQSYPEAEPRTPTTTRLAINKVLLQALDLLAKQRPEAANILKRRFLDQETIQATSLALRLTVDQVKHKQREGLTMLANILYELEAEAREACIMRQETQLEAKSYTQLFGIDAVADQLLTRLTTAVSPWVVSLVGIGGIGKTSLANHVVRQTIRSLYYEDVIWIKINSRSTGSLPFVGPDQTFHYLITQMIQKLLPTTPRDTPFSEKRQQLQQHLKSQPYLIIVDNLEWEADTAYLLGELFTMAQPSRFLLTSRTPPADHAGSLSIRLPELDKANSIALIRHYAMEIGFVQAAMAEEAALLPIFELVGGNPLALKQIVGLAKTRPLPALLASLKQRPLATGEKLYQYILHEAWLTLSHDAKAVLAIMPLAAEGGMDPEQIALLSQLPDAQLWPAINELLGRSLLEIRSSHLWERFYGIHRLTELFIHSLLDKDV